MIQNFPTLAMKNKSSLTLSDQAGCFHCCKIFKTENIKHWTDNEKTAICPECSIDSVVGNNCGFILNEDILKKANQMWYKKA